jgi:hypothetical protein
MSGTNHPQMVGLLLGFLHYSLYIYTRTFWLFNITMEDGPFIDDKHDVLPGYKMLLPTFIPSNYQRSGSITIIHQTKSSATSLE